MNVSGNSKSFGSNKNAGSPAKTCFTEAMSPGDAAITRSTSMVVRASPQNPAAIPPATAYGMPARSKAAQAVSRIPYRCRWGSGLRLMMPPLPTPPTCGPLRDDLPEFLLGLLWKVVPRPGQQQFTPDFVQCENLVELAVGDRGVDVCCHRILDCCAG